MKAHDLMIGDWVRSKYIRTGKQEYQIYPHWYAQIGKDNLDKDLFKEFGIEPIYLTPEILEKNGFVINRGPTSWKLETEREDLIDIYGYRDYHLSINIEDTHGSGKGYRWMLNNFVIHYVHELQHALRLFRIEKEIVI